MVPELITTHVKDGLKRLMTQYKGKKNIEGILRTYLNQIQDLEDAIYPMLTMLDIDEAEGAILDICGGIVGEQRYDFDDDIYRQLIKLRIFILTNYTTIQTAIEVYKVLAQTDSVNYVPLYPAAFALQANSANFLLSPAEVYARMLQVTPAGVGLYLTASPVPEEDVFAFEGVPGKGYRTIADATDAGTYTGLI